jgi:2-oxoglutarate ferredoxin oxidoreductase subunit beta
LIFGKNRDKGIILDGFTPVVVSFEDGKYSPNDVLVHNEKDSTLAFILANMTYNPDVPRPIGVFQSIDKPSYEEKVDNQIEEVTKKLGEGELISLCVAKISGQSFNQFWL